MKRKDLIDLLERNGWKLLRNGGNHDLYEKDGVFETIPRHRELNELLAKRLESQRDSKSAPQTARRSFQIADLEICGSALAERTFPN